MRICKECKNPKTDDGFYLSNQATCKECVKRRTRLNRAENIAYYRSYDRMRYRMDETRQEASKACGKTDAAAEAKKRYAVRTRIENPEKYKARNRVNNSVRSGKVEKGKSCFFCEKVSGLQAHHPDYSRPLDVYWLCPSCHGKVHALNGDFLRPLAMP